MLSMNLYADESLDRKQPNVADSSVICTLGGMALHMQSHNDEAQVSLSNHNHGGLARVCKATETPCQEISIQTRLDNTHKEPMTLIGNSKSMAFR